MSNIKNEGAFINDLINEFPEIKDDVLDDVIIDLTSLQIGYFRIFTQKAIDENKFDLIKKCFSFIEANFDEVNADIRNSLYISYLGELTFSANSKAEKLLPKKLKTALHEVNEYYQTLSKNEKVIMILKDLKKQFKR